MGQVLSRLQQENAEAGKSEIFQQLRPFLTAEDKIPCAEAAQKLGMSESNVKVTVHRLRHRYGELLREEIARTAATPEEVEAEIRDLFAALA